MEQKQLWNIYANIIDCEAYLVNERHGKWLAGDM